MLNSFSKETSLHGFKYFSNKDSRRLGKYFWLISIISSIFGAVVLINKLYTEISKTPIVTVTSNTPVPIEEIPFPAITFCQELRIQESEQTYILMKNMYEDKNYEDILPNGFVET